MVWSDIDYMQNRFRGFEFNEGAWQLPVGDCTRQHSCWLRRAAAHPYYAVACHCTVLYPKNDVARFVRSLNARGQHWIPILDGGIAAAKDYRVYSDAVADDILIKDLTGKATYNGQVRKCLLLHMCWYCGHTSCLERVCRATNNRFGRGARCFRPTSTTTAHRRGCSSTCAAFMRQRHSAGCGWI